MPKTCKKITLHQPYGHILFLCIPGDISETMVGESLEFRSDNVNLPIVWTVVSESLEDNSIRGFSCDVTGALISQPHVPNG